MGGAPYRKGVLAWVTGKPLGVPDGLIIRAVVLVFCLLIERRSVFSRYSQAIGAGEPAALAAGTDVERYKILACVVSGGLAALVGVALAGMIDRSKIPRGQARPAGSFST